MSKILQNQTAAPIIINDVGGVIVPVLPATYTIPPTQYLKWAASSDIVGPVGAPVGNPDIIVNDGSFDLSPSDGIDLIKGIFRGSTTIEVLPRASYNFLGVTTPVVQQTIIDVTFGATELFKLYAIDLACNQYGTWELIKNASTVLGSKRTNPLNPNSYMSFSTPEHFNPTDRLRIVYLQHTAAPVIALDCAVGGTLETV